MFSGGSLWDPKIRKGTKTRYTTETNLAGETPRERSRHYRTNAAEFHLCQMSRMGKSVETESRRGRLGLEGVGTERVTKG